ncbi:TetR family transcriptional regulator [Microtetraspora sp. AC03309]|uniref:TetR family transcriptional regulator n=1 Tax=Microtetraspora sp. AC03309 TaxID=2779376 RepID=UPI001E318763|nr:TetR family transcriptional regulator [Microtetraspora sp. AC03309]MCC5581541.1 TetR family transcriptional regulator [Microtetraspora sp. AC03309]
MAGLREDKKRRTRQAIADVAMRLFAERGFEAVTVNEIADAAGVAKVTLFKYFPAKESLVLHAIEEEDLAGIVAGRRPGQSPLEALRAHFLAFAAEPGIADTDGLVAQMKVIVDSPALTAAANRLQYGQRRALARALSGDHGPSAPCEPTERAEAQAAQRPAELPAGPGTTHPTGQAAERDGAGLAAEHSAGLAAELAAAQISAAVLTIQETFFHRVASGMPLHEAGRRLAGDVDLAFDLLENGLARRFGP